jgi:hypothetical protein
MFVRWQWRWRRHSQFGDWREPDVHWSAIIVESARVDGRPVQRHVAYLVGFTESAAAIPAQRCHLWDRVTARLNQLGNRVTDRAKIEAAIAEKVPRPTLEEYKAIARKGVQLLGWEWITDQQRAALADEAEHWQDRKGDRASGHCSHKR